MNARYLLHSICAALLFISTQSSANAHDSSPPDWGWPTALSTLPYEPYRYDDYYSDYAYGHEYRYRYAVDSNDYGMRNACLNSNLEYYKVVSKESVEKKIDWCALAPFQPRYSPQIPASWRWRHREPSHQRVYWHHRRTR
jgi:hypothetical protein